MAAVDNDTLVRDFVEAFNTKDADRLAPFLHEDIVFSNYGDVVIAEQIHGLALPCGSLASGDPMRCTHLDAARYGRSCSGPSQKPATNSRSSASASGCAR